MIPPTGRTAGAICAVLGVLLVSVMLASEFLARPWVVVGASMEPALRAGDRIVVDVWTYGHRLPRPGEIVLFRPAPGSAAVVKRVARVLPAPDGGGAAVWVLGDNPRDSLDSRQLGAIPAHIIIGRVALRVGAAGNHEFR